LGENRQGELGHSSNNQNKSSIKAASLFQAEPKKIEISGKSNFFVDVACGDGHSLALTSAREIFVWGNNKDGQLG